MTDEKEIIENIKNGDLDSFRLVVDNYERLVYHIALRLTNNEADIEDICQDIFIKIYKKISTFKYQSKLSTWIASIAYNTCLNHLKVKKINYNNFQIDENTISSDLIIQPCIETKIEKEYLRDYLNSLLEKLPLQYRTVLTLYHLEEFKYEEISKIMNLPIGTVKNYLFRARKILKDSIQ